MPRKSKTVRLAQARALKAGYEAAEAQKLGPFDFICQMIGYMERDKYPSKRQRDWLDKLIDDGVPEPKGDSDSISRMKAAIAVFTKAKKSWEADTLRDFIARENRGWGFSDKQAALRDRLLAQSEVVDAGDHILQVTPEMRTELENAVKLYAGYSDMWKGERPAVYRAVSAVKRFLSGDGDIEQYHYDKVTKAVAAQLRKLSKPRWKQGDMGFTFQREIAMCVSDVFVTDGGRISNEWVVGGVHRVMAQENVFKR
jgi:hypothetical protein